MILSDRDILRSLKNGDLKIEPFDRDLLQPSTVDFRLDHKIRVFDNWQISLIDLAERKDVSRAVDIGEGGFFVIHPGEFILGSTVERIKIPRDIAAKVEGKSSLGRLGLIIHATAGYLDPGFKGNVTLEMSNLSRLSIKLYAGMKICQVAFLKMSSPVMIPYGSKKLGSKYQDQRGPTSSKIWKDFNHKQK
ncbi:dCTP deaminase [Candidatus Woesebacteria bacterium RIFCSPHIGHO2_02_FULL_38_9]|uniref:dCTP deaminase, dUMP-forming n=1 Tax=Candidatus Woesebacteria bacterium RIFCSPHIGHO2_01_FULL_39_28 TaxID=1802496 RepID=A0A1F7YFM2_9BACT|nr:MAG: dCTP deaminase [Candidatus Woesebacteria bacterium RIFCSPHIGHO2_01_FULL_39_28]OGM33634.1 MAG: dCTP deaminase [Candidatus Woesebacteria bacterium RIFCSPHIGHO2_02_FULL_38_9]OGM58545.1 MAG: dCTP deaminase [Candidatus Woesebacteria bacterium RIFCSPLOWO2_01_FULL_38_20]